MRFWRKRNVHCHLVTVEIRVKCGTNERVNLDGLSFDEHRLESLNTKAVQRRSAVEQNGVVLNDFLENIPHHRVLPLDHFFCGLHCRAVPALLEPVVDKGLEQFERHLLR